MITLYSFGPMFGLPHPSPFVIKADILLKMSGLEYREAPMTFNGAPKGKVPYISDDGLVLGDSYFIRRHLETRYKIDYSGGYDAEKLALAWAIERMLEEHLYFLSVCERWLVDENFEKGPRQFFNMAPAPIRPILRVVIRRKVRKMLKAQGLGRHTAPERLELANGDANSVAALLGNDNYLLGDKICGADASVFGSLYSASSSYFNTELGAYIRSQPKIMAYLERMRARFFPEGSDAKA
jgi:glutathione S-transferase